MKDPYEKMWSRLSFYVPQYIKDCMVISMRNEKINEILKDEIVDELLNEDDELSLIDELSEKTHSQIKV